MVSSLRSQRCFRKVGTNDPAGSGGFSFLRAGGLGKPPVCRWAPTNQQVRDVTINADVREKSQTHIRNYWL